MRGQESVADADAALEIGLAHMIRSQATITLRAISARAGVGT